MKRKMGLAILVAACAALLLVGVVAATTIVIDGTREAAWDTGGGIDDPSEAGISNDGVDIRRIEWTNDTTYFYFLIGTHLTTTWDIPGFNDPYITICINIDNNTGTGSVIPLVCDNPPGGGGYDRYIQINGPSLSVAVYDAAFTTISAPGASAASAGIITEVRVPLAALGLSSTLCGDMPASAYMDGRTTDPDDRVSDTADFMLHCGAPTAVSLSSMSASADTKNGAALPLALVGGAAVILIGTVFFTRRGRKHTA